MEQIISILKSKMDATPKIAVQLGSGLQFLADSIENPVHIPYSSLPGFPEPTVEGHGGSFIYGYKGDVPVLFLAGRIHYYEGHDLETVTLGAKIVAALSIPVFLITNAAGAVNTSFKEGDIMIIDDHINFSGQNPLHGPKHPDAPRFPDQSDVYKKQLRAQLDAAAKKAAVEVQHGVYMWFSGPTYETPAEVRMARAMGADAVGMSTVPEAMVANSLGVQCIGISMISNLAAGVKDQPLNHDEVLEASQIASKSLSALFDAFLEGEF